MDRSKLQVVVMSGGAPASRALGQWLGQRQLDWRYGSETYGIDQARNLNIRKFMLEDVLRGKEFLLMIDHDMVPIPETEPILTETGAIIHCGYSDRYGSLGHFGDGDFGAACFRVSAALLLRMNDPWFKTLYDTTGSRCRCECNYFREQIEHLGIFSRMVGIIGHEQRCILVPKDRTSYEVRWPTAS